jgi:hypothetical protein
VIIKKTLVAESKGNLRNVGYGLLYATVLNSTSFLLHSSLSKPPEQLLVRPFQTFSSNFSSATLSANTVMGTCSYILRTCVTILKTSTYFSHASFASIPSIPLTESSYGRKLKRKQLRNFRAAATISIVSNARSLLLRTARILHSHRALRRNEIGSVNYFPLLSAMLSWNIYTPD